MNVLALVLLVAQITLPHLPDIPRLPGVPQLPSTIPLPPLTKAPPDSIVVQPTQKLRQVPELDSFVPARFSTLADLPRSADGSFRLSPGAFELIDQSFCLRAGGHGPSTASAYLIGALSGSRAAYVSTVLTSWRAQPAIAQGDVQSLLWAITSQAKISALPDRLQSAARALLTPQQIDQLNGGALGSVADFLARSGVALPAPVRDMLDTENRVRDLLMHGNSSYQQLAALAVPVVATAPDGGRNRWSYDPRGFFVRYLPQSYSTTTIQLYVPPVYTVIHDGAGRVVRLADDRGSQLDVDYIAATAARMTLSRITPVSDIGSTSSRVELGTASLQPSSLVTSDASLRALDAVVRAAEPLTATHHIPFTDGRDVLAFLRGAVPAALCKTLGGCGATRVAGVTLVGLGPAGATYDPTTAMGTPADGALQPLAQSGQPTPSDKNKDCARVRDEIAFDRAYQQLYNDPALVKEAQTHNWSGQEFQNAVHDKGHAANVGGSGFQEGGWTDFEKCEKYIPTREQVASYGWPPIFYDAIENHENAHVARCLEARKTGDIDDWKWRQQTEIQGYDRSIETLSRWVAANC